MSVTREQDIPPCDIRINKEGVWYFRGAEMFRREIINFFYQNLHRDGSGRYLIELGDERCYLDVEDTPFVIKGVYAAESGKDETESLFLMICDETTEKLDPSTLRVGHDNVLYCAIRNGEFLARFSRAAYYQLADYFDYDPDKDRYYMVLNGTLYEINTEPTGIKNDGGASC